MSWKQKITDSIPDLFRLIMAFIFWLILLVWVLFILWLSWKTVPQLMDYLSRTIFSKSW